MEHANIVFLTPGHSVTADYLKSLLPTLTELAKRNITWAFSNHYSSLVADAREITLSGQLENNILDSRPFCGNITYDKLMWIDSDISWKPEDVIKLYESDKDIIAGAYLFENENVAVYPKMFEKPYTKNEILKLTELIKVDSVGFGFLCVKQGVFESLTRPWFQTAYHKMINAETKEEIILPVMGEDISWCVRVQHNNYEIWFDPTVRVNHHKQIKLSWDK